MSSKVAQDWAWILKKRKKQVQIYSRHIVHAPIFVAQQYCRLNSPHWPGLTLNKHLEENNRPFLSKWISEVSCECLGWYSDSCRQHFKSSEKSFFHLWLFLYLPVFFFPSHVRQIIPCLLLPASNVRWGMVWGGCLIPAHTSINEALQKHLRKVYTWA